MPYSTRTVVVNLVGALIGAVSLACAAGPTPYPDTATVPPPSNGNYADLTRARAACSDVVTSYGAQVNDFGRQSYDGYGRYTFDLTLKNRDGVWPCTYDARQQRAEIPTLANGNGRYNGGYNSGGYNTGDNSGWTRPGGNQNGGYGDLGTRAVDACVNAARYNKNWDVLDVRAPVSDDQDHYRVDMLVRDGNNQKQKSCRYDVRNGSTDL